MDIKTSLRMNWLSLRLLFKKANMYVFIVSIYAAMLQWNKIPRALEVASGLRLNVYGYAVSFFSTSGATLALALGALAMYSTLPLLRENTVSEIMRCNRETWLLSRILYVFVLGMFYPAVMLLSAGLTTFGSLAVTQSWGKLLNTYARGIAIDGAAMTIEINTEMTAFHPCQAFLLTWSLQACACITMGLVTLCMSLLAGRGAMLMVGGTLAVLDFLIAEKFPYVFYRFSPFTWTRFSMMASSENGFVPSVHEAFSIFAGIDVILVLVVFLCGKREKKMSSILLSEQY